jgi:hypothetical protein
MPVHDRESSMQWMQSPHQRPCCEIVAPTEQDAWKQNWFEPTIGAEKMLSSR